MGTRRLAHAHASKPEREGWLARRATAVPCREAGRLSHELADVEYIEYHWP